MKKLKFMVVDTETATLPFADEIANGDPERKKKIAIAKPLIYDIGWTICDRAGNIHERKQFLIAETFAVPAIFNTAYYAEKRPIYLDMLKEGETTIKPWNEVMEIFISDMSSVDGIGAFNAMFDFKKAIPFTELYIQELYSPNYNEWEQIQRKSAARIADGEKNQRNPDFEAEIFRFRGKTYSMFDLWGLATTHLLNNTNYKNKCLENGLLTNSGTFFKTSAESTFQYLCDVYDFEESHTALDDAIIESYILHKIAQRHAITPGIKFFPFRDLGATDDFCMRRKKANKRECETVFCAMAVYVEAKQEEANTQDKALSTYCVGLVNRMRRLAEYAGLDCKY